MPDRTEAANLWSMYYISMLSNPIRNLPNEVRESLKLSIRNLPIELRESTTSMQVFFIS